MIKITLLISQLISIITSTHFTFDPSTRLTSAENWLNQEVPCVGDHIRFDNSEPVVAFVDHNVDVESITLPDNGIITFTDNGVDLGGDANWQCAKRENGGRDAFFTQDETQDTSFYNPSNWILEAEEESFLHMNQVPSEDDEVTISTLTNAQIYLDLPVTVNRFQYYKRERMTTEDFNVLIRSMEGQFQIVLPRPWAHESDQGGVQRMVAEDAIKVGNRDIKEEKEGRVNGNSKNETLSTICQYLTCPDPSDLPCIASFTPFGHCCPVCGARITLAAWEMDFEWAQTKVKHVLEGLAVYSKIHVSAERKTTGEMDSEYEIVLAHKINETFDEDLFILAAQRIADTLAISLTNHNHKSIIEFSIHTSKIDRTIRTVSKVVASIIYFTIVITLIAGFVYQNLEVRVSSRNLLNPVVVRYRRNNDDVAIELEDVVVGDSETSDDVADDVADEKMINPNFEEVSVSNSEDVESEEEEDDVADSELLNPNFESPTSELEDVPTPPPGDIQLIDL